MSDTEEITSVSSEEDIKDKTWWSDWLKQWLCTCNQNQSEKEETQYVSKEVFQQENLVKSSKYNMYFRKCNNSHP